MGPPRSPAGLGLMLRPRPSPLLQPALPHGHEGMDDPRCAAAWAGRGGRGLARGGSSGDVMLCQGNGPCIPVGVRGTWSPRAVPAAHTETSHPCSLVLVLPQLWVHSLRPFLFDS